MHRLLHILEILEIVFNLAFEEPGTGPKSLIALACTCRSFQDTALDILYRAIPNFAALIRCLVPSDAWGLKGSFSLALKRPVILSDWDRLKTFTPRIRRLGSWGIAPDIASALKQCGMLPLPNLQVYRYEVSPSAGSLAFGPNLLELEVVFCGRAHFPRQLVNSLKISSPSLRKMTIESRLSAPSPNLPNSFGSIITYLNRLEFLSIVNFILPDDAIRTLGPSHIRSLKSDNTAGDFLRCLPSCGSILPDLEDFSFRTGDLSESSDLIRRLAPRRLRSIAVMHDDKIARIPLVEYRAREFFQTLKIHCGSAVLTSIVLRHKNPSFDYENQEDLVCSMETLEPLLSFRNLHELDLFLYEIDYQLYDSSIERMAAAWPQMRRFCLDFESHWALEAQSAITLEGLVPMAKNWPHLEHLSLTFDTGLSNDTPLPKPGAGLCCPHLQCIDVGYSILHETTEPEPWRVGAFLTAIFPNLCAVDYRYDTGDWDFINSMMEATRKVGKQERAHACEEWADKNTDWGWHDSEDSSCGC